MEYLSTYNRYFPFTVMCLFLLAFTSVIGQGSTSFYKTYTGGLFDFGQGITQLDNGKYAVTGSTSSLGDNSSKALLMVIDEEGNHEWTKGYGGANSDWGRRIFHETGSGFWIAGYSNSYGDASFDFTLLKTDESGELEWEQHYGTADRERLWDAIRIDDGSFILVGETEGALSDGKDILIMRVDEDGELMWTERIQSELDDIAYTVGLYNDTTLIIGGVSSDNSINQKGFLTSFHIDGNQNWMKFYDDSGKTVIRDVSFFDNQIFAGGSVVLSGNNYMNSWIIRTDAQGEVLFESIESWVGDEYVSNILALDVERVYWSQWTTSTQQSIFMDGPDVFINRFHRGLYFFGFAQSFSGIDTDEFHQLVPTDDGGFICVGYCSDIRTEESPGNNVMIVKIGPNDESENTAQQGVDLVSISDEKLESFSIYPNPSSEVLNVSGINIPFNYKILDVQGKEHKKGEGNQQVDISNLPKGMYFLQINSTQNKVIFKFVKK